MSIDTIRLEIDGTISHITNHEECFCPHIDLLPMSASVSSISLSESSKKKKKKTILTRSRYNFLCGKVILILIVELAILLCVLFTKSCSFYSITFVNNQDQIMILNIGLFRYSLASDLLSDNGSQCTRYNNSHRDEGSIMGNILLAINSNLTIPQMFSIISPILGVVGCIFVPLQLLISREIYWKWSTSAILFSAAILQALVMVLSDKELIWYVPSQLMMPKPLLPLQLTFDFSFFPAMVLVLYLLIVL
jgi:hypothetical protein